MQNGYNMEMFVKLQNTEKRKKMREKEISKNIIFFVHIFPANRNYINISYRTLWMEKYLFYGCKKHKVNRFGVVRTLLNNNEFNAKIVKLIKLKLQIFVIK